jgi:hypothetical protein
MCKKLFVLALVLGLASFASAGLLSNYEFPEAAGTNGGSTTGDSGPRAVPGTLMGSATIIADDGSLATASNGKAGGQVLSLNGTTDYVNIGGAGSSGWADHCVWPCGTSPAERSVGTWYKGNDYYATDSWKEVTAEGGNWDMMLGYGRFSMGWWHVGQISVFADDVGLGDGNWHQLTATLQLSPDGVAPGYMRLFVDGWLVRTVTHYATSQGSWVGPRIGNGSAGWTEERFLTGELDQVYYTDDLMGTAEIKALTGIPEPATIALLGLGALALIRRKR